MGLDAIYEWLLYQLQHNQVFAGLAGASFVVPALYYLRNVPTRLWVLIERQSTVRLVVTNDDSAFENVNEWLAKLEYAKRVRRLRLTTWWDDNQSAWTLAPGEGWHAFLHRGRPVFVNRTMDEGSKQTASFRVRERIEIIVLGRSQAAMRAVVQDAQDVHRSKDAIKVYVWNGYWELVGWKMKRPARTLVLGEGMMEGIVNDIAWFLSSKEWYRERGIPYRRGYLLQGPPGTGKSSLVSVVASHFSLPIYIMNLSTVNDDNSLLSAFSRAPTHAILLIEDVDAATLPVGRSRKQAPPASANGSAPPSPEDRPGVSLSGLLNAIDGVASPEGRVLMLTTNHPERLDAALVRPGRVDRSIVFGSMRPAEKRALAELILGDTPDAWNMEHDHTLQTPAQVQAACAEIALQRLYEGGAEA